MQFPPPLGEHTMNRIPGIFVCVLACVFAAPAPADQIGYTYDALGRLKTVGYEDGTVVRYDYDSAGNRTSRVVESGRFSINNVTAQEGNSLTFTVTRSGPTSATQSVSYATANGTAAAGWDYKAKSGSLSFAPGQSSKTVTIGGIEDSTFEPNETFYVNLSSATQGATIADSQGLGTIVNDDAGPAFAINNVTAQEGKALTFTITKSGSTSLTHNVNYATANGTAEAGWDYVAKSGTLSLRQRLERRLPTARAKAPSSTTIYRRPPPHRLSLIEQNVQASFSDHEHRCGNRCAVLSVQSLRSAGSRTTTALCHRPIRRQAEYGFAVASE